MSKGFKVGEAPWELEARSDAKDDGGFAVGQAPWEKDAAQGEVGPSGALSAVRKAVQGASAGFSDEISGGLDAAGRVIGLDGLGSKPLTEISLAEGGPTLDSGKIKKAYADGRDRERSNLATDSKSNPGISTIAELAGGLASPLNKVTKGMSLAKAGAVYGGAAGLGTSESEDAAGLAKDTALGSALGYGGGKAFGLAGNAAKSGLSKLGGKLEKTAEALAENATGATRVQAEKFQDGAGRELLDRGLVKFGDTPSKIAERVSKANDEAGTQIQSALKSLDESGVKASADKVVEVLESRAKELDKDASQAPIAKKIRSMIEDIVNTGESEVSISSAEKTKRGYGEGIRNWQDKDAGKASKEAYLAYRNEAERAATEAAPETAALFKEGKKTFGLLAPIEEAAEKRARQLNQHPLGGLNDIASLGAGAATAGPVGAIATALGRRVVAPRMSSTLAVSADKVSKMLLARPDMANLAKTNPKAFQATVLKMVEGMTERGSMPKAALNEPNELDRDSSRPSNYQEQPKEEIKREPQSTPQPKGQDKWAADGFENVAKADPSFDREALMNNPRARNLLIAASDLRPGSRAMNDVVAKLKRYGGSN